MSVGREVAPWDEASCGKRPAFVYIFNKGGVTEKLLFPFEQSSDWREVDCPECCAMEDTRL